MKDILRSLKMYSDTPIVGLGLCLGSVRVAEMVSQTSFDYVMVDMLHSHFTKETATGSIRSLARSEGPIPFGRVANNDAGEINELLDAGAMGIVVPMIGSGAESMRAVEASYYPPIGKRSKGSPAAVFYGNDYYSKINRILNLIVMIETPEAAEKADEILSVPGITGCLIGAGDLSFIMQESDFDSQFGKVVDHIISAGETHHVAIGISVNSPEELKAWWSKGIDFFLFSHDMGVLNSGILIHEKKYTQLKLQGKR